MLPGGSVLRSVWSCRVDVDNPYVLVVDRDVGIGWHTVTQGMETFSGLSGGILTINQIPKIHIFVRVKSKFTS